MRRPTPSLQCVGVWLLLVAVLPATAGVRINEIHYRPKNESTEEEFIELWNHGEKTVSLAGWRLDRGVDFSFTNQVLPPDTGLVIASNPRRLAGQHPNLKNIAGPWNGRLGNNGELIRLIDASGKTVDKVRYATEGNWSRRVRGPLQEGHRGWVWHSRHDAGGRSLELRQPDLPSGHGQNWATSQTDGGTPGIKNSVHTDDLPPMILEAAHSPSLPTSTEGVTVSVSIVDEKIKDVTAQLHFRNDGTEKFETVAMKRQKQNLFKAFIPPRPDSTVVEFFVAALDSSKNKRTWPNAGPDCPRALYQVADNQPGPGRPVHRIILTSKERSELATIGKLPWYRTSDAQMNGTFINREGGKVSVRYNVGVRLRGTTSRAAEHKSRQVNFPNDQPWQNRTSVNLNAVSPHVQELGSALFRLACLPALRARAVRVLENNQPLGGPSQFHHYVELDPLNSEYIDWQFPDDDNGNLYKGGGHADLKFLGDTAAPYAELHYYSKRTNRWLNDYTDLIDFLRALGQADSPMLPESLPQHMNLENWTRHLAVHDLLGNEETSLVTGNRGDYALYAGVNDSRFIFIPYDLDGILGVNGGEKSPLLRVRSNTSLNQLLKHPIVAASYWRQLEALANSVFEPKNFSLTVDQLTGDYLPVEERNRIKTFATDRRAFALSQIPKTFSLKNLLPKQGEWFISNSSEIELSGVANASNTAKIRVNGQFAQLKGPLAEWNSKVILNQGLNQVLIQAYDDNGLETQNEYVPIWHGANPIANIHDSIENETTWTDKKPLLITKPLLVKKDAKLIIEPGTTICFSPNAYLQIAGQLIANGEAEKRIQFLGLPQEDRPWGGIRFINATKPNRLQHIDFHRTSSSAIAITNSVLEITNAKWHQTKTNIISFRDASLKVYDSVFPTLEHSEHVTGFGILKGGELLFKGCEFGQTSGSNDVMDISGGKRPGPILELYESVFLGGNDDGLDLDGMDAFVDDCIFSNFDNAKRLGYFSAAIATGKPKPEAGVWLNVQARGNNKDIKPYRVRVNNNGQFTDPNLNQSIYASKLDVSEIEDTLTEKYISNFNNIEKVIVKTDESHITVTRSIFHKNDYHILLKEDARLFSENNTFLTSWYGAIAFDEPRHDVELPKGALLSGNIFHDNPLDLIHLNQIWLDNSWVWLHVFDSIIRPTHVWFGQRNIEANPLLNYPPGDVSLSHGSPAIGNGPNGLDMGAKVPGGASISGEPAALTRASSALLVIGGPGITHYRYRINNGALSDDYPVSEPISMTGLAPGEYCVQVIGRNAAGRWQYLSNATHSKRWRVNPKLSRIQINELLAWPNGDSLDQVELLNSSANATQLGGFSLSDNPAKPRKFVFPENTSIESDSFLVIKSTNEGGMDFRLDKNGEGLWFYDAEGSLIDSVVFGKQIEGLSIGRFGRDGKWTLTYPTLGKENQITPLGQFQDIRLAGWSTNPLVGENDQIIIKNSGKRPVNLEGLGITNKPIGQPNAFTFPSLYFIDGSEQLIIKSNQLGFKLASSQGELALKNPAGKWIDHFVYGPQPYGHEEIIPENTKLKTNTIILDFKISQEQFQIMWESKIGQIFRILSKQKLSKGPWHQEAILVAPHGPKTQFKYNLNNKIKFFLVEQID